jgi:ribonuclease G
MKRWPCARAARRPEERRLPDHRPDRGADHGGREHRRLRRRAQLRRHHLQDQPRGGQAIARQLRLRNLGGIIIIDFIDMSREDHQHAVLAELRKQLSTRPHQDHGERLHAAGPGGDDAQAHPRVARPHAVRTLPHLRAARARSRPRAVSATTSCARSCARRGSSTRRSSASSPAAAVVEMLLDEESQHLAGLSDFIGKPISLKAEPTSARPSSTTSF